LLCSGRFRGVGDDTRGEEAVDLGKRETECREDLAAVLADRGRLAGGGFIHTQHRWDCGERDPADSGLIDPSDGADRLEVRIVEQAGVGVDLAMRDVRLLQP
jgi:hypothetical protein